MRQSLIARLVLVERALRPSAAWEHTEGLYSLLEAARHLPQRDPFALPEAESNTGMGKLLKEARRRLGQEEEG